MADQINKALKGSGISMIVDRRVENEVVKVIPKLYQNPTFVLL